MIAEKVDAREFIRKIRTAQQGVVFMNEDHVLHLGVIDNGKQTVYEAPDPLDMESQEECVDFLVHVYQALSDRAVMANVSYLG